MKERSNTHNVESIVNRSLEMGLNFTQTYFIVMGDYPTKGCLKSLYYYVEQGVMEIDTYINLIQKMPIDLESER